MNDYRILVPLDGSKLAEQALAYLPRLRRLAADLRVTLLSVVEQPDEPLGFTEAIDREQSLLSAYIHKVKADLERRLRIRIDAEVRSGVPAEAILRLEEELKPDLTIIATHGRTGLARWRLGSVADKVIRGARSNTLVIGPEVSQETELHGANSAPTFKGILVPLDGSDRSEKALPVADQLAEASQAELHLMRVLTPAIYTERPLGSEGGPSNYFFTIPQARDYLEVAAKSLTRPEHAKFEVRLGWPEEQLSQYAAAHGIDLIVLTTHGRGGLARIALGSVVDRLLGGPLPLLIVRSMGEDS